MSKTIKTKTTKKNDNPTSKSSATKTKPIDRLAARKRKESSIKRYTGSKTTHRNNTLSRKCSGDLCGGRMRPITDFGFLSKNTGRYYSRCKKCMKIYNKKCYQNRIKGKHDYPSHRICPDCELDLPIERFNLKSGDERQPRCGRCAYALKNSENKTEKRTAQFINWYENCGGKDFVKKYNKYRGGLDKKTLNADPTYCIVTNVQCHIYETLKKYGMQWDHKIKYLGINVQTFKDWLEYQFTDEMSWNNYGTYWHVDHVKPCASFTFESMRDPSIYEYFGWQNVKPMIITDNFTKGNEIDETAIEEQKIFVSMFKYDYELNDNE